MILRSGLPDLVETTPFDRGCTNSPHCVIVNLTFERWKAAGCPASGSRPGEGERIGTFPEGAPMLRCNVSAPWETMDGDWEAGPLYSGTSAALINSVEPVSQLLARTSAESEAALRRSIDHLHKRPKSVTTADSRAHLKSIGFAPGLRVDVSRRPAP